MGETAQFILRELTSDDATAAAELDKKCFGKGDAFSRNYFLYAALNSQAAYFVAETDGEIIACAGAEIDDDGSAEIESIAVAPDYRRQGIGTLILSKLIDTIKERGAKVICLEVHTNNTPAINLYKHFGFKIIGSIKNFYSNGDALLMTRKL